MRRPCASRRAHLGPIGDFPANLPQNRLGLARWLVNPRHPLTARVIVNRYWAMFFGRGLVATLADFGNQGRLPSHPQLLDWLATTFIDSGWNLKALQKRIVLSATYRQESTTRGEAARTGSRERVARARTVVSTGGRADSRQCAGGQRAPGPHRRRAERLSVPAARTLGSARHAECDQVRAGQGCRPLSPQPVHGVEAVVAAAIRRSASTRPSGCSARSTASAPIRRSSRWCC